MGAIGKLFKNKQIVTIVALILCFGILVFAYRYRVDSAINAVSIPVASRKLEARELIDETCFETRKVAQSMLSDNVIRSKSELLGDETTGPKYVNYNTFIPEGSLFYRSAVTTWSNMPDSAWSDIPDGETIFSLKVDQNSTYGNSIFPGDRIDIFLQGYDNSNKYFIGPLVEGIKILAVKDSDGSHIFKRSADQKNASALIFSVDSSKFLFFKRAVAFAGEGNIIPVPRNEKYSLEAEEIKGSDYIISYVNSNSYESSDDAIESNKNINIKVSE